MTAKNHEKNGVFVPPNSHFSYVLSITLPQPTIRIKIPKVLVKAMQRRNQTRSQNDENGGKNKKKHRATSKKSFRKKVGSMFSNVFGGKNKKSKGENGEIHDNGDGDDEEEDEMKKLKNMIESLDMGSEKIITRKSSEDHHINLTDGVQQMVTVATGFGISESELVVKEKLEAEDEEEEEKTIVKAMVGAVNERKERPRPRSMRTFSKTMTKINDLELKKAKINNFDDSIVVGNTDLSVDCVDDDKVANAVDTKGIVSLKQAENPRDLTRFRSKTMTNHNRKPKIAWTMRRVSSVLVGGKSENLELCKKRILMGGRCRPLNHSGIIQYDKNGVLMPEIIP
ncbi:hypothetical protein REPUB_Repub06bG0009700 [Reevesia pubescens]